MVHLRHVDPEIAPGVLWTRICTMSGSLIAEHPLDDLTQVNQVAMDDRRAATIWLNEHTLDVVYLYIYDGDSGECLKTIIMDNLPGRIPKEVEIIMPLIPRHARNGRTSLYVYRYKITHSDVPDIPVGMVLIDKYHTASHTWEFIIPPDGVIQSVTGNRIGKRLCPVCYEDRKRCTPFGHPEAHADAPRIMDTE